MTTRAKEISELGNTGFLELDTNGNLGIGTTSPEHKLHVKSTTHDEPIALFEADTGTGGDVSIRLEGGASGNADEVYIEFSDRNDPTNSFAVGMDDDASKLFFGYGALGTMNGHTQMVLQSNGNVGIGTSNPTQTLHVEGDIRLGSGNASRKIVFGSAGAANDYIELIDVNSSANIFNLVQDGDSKLVVQGVTGNVGIGTDSPTNNLTIYTTSSYGGMDIDNGSYRHTIGTRGNTVDIIANIDNDDAAGDIRFHVGGTGQEKMIIERSGNVGIGTNSPEGQLHVRNTGTGNGTYIENDFGWTAANLGEFSNSAFTIRPRDSDVYLKTSGSSNDVRIQAINNANDTAKAILLNPFGGDVSINTTSTGTPLYIKGTGGSGDTTLKIDDASSGAISNHIQFYRSGSIARVGFRGDLSNDPFFIRRSGNYDLIFRSDGTMAIGEPYDKANAVAGLHVIDRSFSYWDSTLSKRSCALRVETYWSAAGGERAVGDYGGGIAFNHLGGHSASHDGNVHAAIVLRVEDTPGHERSNLVFATNNDTSTEDGGLTERMAITPSGKVTIGDNLSEPNNLLRVGPGGIYVVDGGVGKVYNQGAQIPQSAIVIPVTNGRLNQNVNDGDGWANIGWATTSRSGEIMHRNTNGRYKVSGSGDACGFYIEAGTSEAGGICLDEDSVQVYGSSDNGTTFRIIDKDSDIVTAEMLQSSWNWNVRGSINASASMSSISDQRLKKGFLEVSSDGILDSFANLQLKSYIRVDTYDYMKNNYTDEEELREVGFVAQEVEAVFPDCVGTTPIVDPRGMDSIWEEIGEELTEIKNVNVNQMLYKTMQAVQELIKENNDLKARLAALESN